MKIEKYKHLGNGKYKVTIDNADYIIYEDIILKYSLLGKDKIPKKELDLCLKDNEFYEAYYKAISYIKTRLRAKLEIIKYLNKVYRPETVKNVVDRLQKEGYLDQNVYAEAYITDQINLKIAGPLKVESELLKLGINKDVIDKQIYNEVYQKEENV